MGTFAGSSRTAALNAARDAALDAITPSLNNGTLRIYGGAAPANADAALGGATLLAQLGLSSTAFGAASNGVATANPVADDVSADATGTPTFFRLLNNSGATVYQGSAGASGQELNLSNLSAGQIVEDGLVSVASLTVTASATF